MFRSSRYMEKTQSERSVNFSPHSIEEPESGSAPAGAGSDSSKTPFHGGFHGGSDSLDSDRKSDASRKSDTDVSQDKENRDEEDRQKESKKEDEEEMHHHNRHSSNDVDTNLLKLSEEVDDFLTSKTPQEIPESIEKFANLVQIEIVKCVSGDVSSLKLFEETDDESPSILESIERISKLTTMLADFKAEKDVISLVNLTSTVLQRAMSFLEEEFRTILDVVPSKTEVGSSSRKTRSGSFKDPDRCTFNPNPQPDQNQNDEDNFPGFSMETVTNLKKIASAMTASGYGTECLLIYTSERRNAFEDKLMKIGYEKISIDDVQKMSWESLEGEISSWIKVMKQAVDVYFPAERKLCEQIFGEKSGDVFHNLTRNIALQLLNFAEAVAMTKRSAEKLFKFLDTYETVRDVIPTLNELFECDTTHEMKKETQSARYRLGEAACLIFCDLENSIKSDSGKTPVPGGAVHPLTRYTLNYVKYACEYKDTLEQVFQENRSTSESDNDTSSSQEEQSERNDNQATEDKPSPFSEQLMTVMDLLDSNLEGKSKLYKDQSLSYIFLMNNGRYIMQKIKESGEIYQLLGNTWSRKRSSDLRQYHKNYQRETWSKVLGCLSHDGIQVNGKVQKPVLKERFKNFNALFEEIHKTQSTWIVSDNQLQSELQVSICAVVVPAYRAFLGRFEQYLDAGRQTEKYIKFGSEDIETAIDDLFNGNQSFAARKNNK